MGRTALVAVVGSLPAALLDVLAGSVAAELANPARFAPVLLPTGAAWKLGALIERRSARRCTDGVT